MRLSTLLALALVACSPTEAPTRCTPNVTIACVCPGGASSGVQACDATGTGYGACQCAAPDGGSADVVDAGSAEDRPAAIDAPRADVVDAGAGLDVVDAGGGASDVLTGGDVACREPAWSILRRCTADNDCNDCAPGVSGLTWCCGLTGYCENSLRCRQDGGRYMPDAQIDCVPNTGAPVLHCRTHEDCARTCMALPDRVWCCGGGECGTRMAASCGS